MNKFACLLFTTFFVVVVLIPSVSAQTDDDDPPPDAVLAPKKTISKDEKTALEAQSNNIKKRTKISLELMETRMERAEKSQAAGDFNATLVDLGGFNGLLDDALDFLLKTDSGKADRSFINFEIYLRKQVPRLETIRREMPYKYGFHVGKIMKAVRDARAKAVEPLFGDNVVPASKKP